MAPWILVSPSSRGIGLSLARRLLRLTNLPIVSTARRYLDRTREAILRRDDDTEGSDDVRREAKGAEEERLKVMRLDVEDETSIADAASTCRSLFPSKSSSSQPPSHLHLAFVIPGILHPEKSPAQLNHEHILQTFKINTIGPMLILKHFSGFLPRKRNPLPLLDAGELGIETGTLPERAVWATMSARVGSIADNDLGGWYSYRASKAAVNQLTKSFDNHLRTSSGENAAAVSLHPGTVKTGLSREFWGNVREGKLFSPGFAAERLVDVVRECGGGGEAGLRRHRGRCWDWAGEEIPP